MERTVIKEDIQVSIPLSAIMALIERLKPLEMYLLYKWLEATLLALEDELLATNPRLRKEIEEARAEYEAGDYVTFEELQKELAAQN